MLDDKDRKNVLKNNYYDEKVINNDQTIILQAQPNKMDGPQ